MTTLFLLILLVALFVAACRQASMLDVSGRMGRFSRGFDLLLRFLPLLAVAVFAVLFLFVLKGRFYERLSHAVLVFALWLYAARFYWMLISFFKHRRMLAFAIPGMAGFAATAIVLTPLDRYVNTVHSVLGPASILAGAGMLVLFYAAAYVAARSPKGKHETRP